MVPKAGLEPARVAPLPPQDSVSTKFHHFGTEKYLTPRRYSAFAGGLSGWGAGTVCGTACSCTGGGESSIMELGARWVE